jgi:CheY-like chemotaxis protein
MHTPPLVLIADDDPDFKEVLSAKLLKAGLTIAEAKDGNEAITKAKSILPDLIIMDIQMPGTNGTEAVLDLKQNPETKNIQIVFFSNLLYPWPGIKKENDKFAQELGAITFLRKSDELDSIVRKVQELIAQTPAA